MTGLRIGLIPALLVGCATIASAGELSTLDLSKPFATRTAWRFTATQGPKVEAITYGKEPGAIALCVSNDNRRSCLPDLTHSPGVADDIFTAPHYPEAMEIVRPRSESALLLLRTASLHSGDGDQRVVTRLLAYDRARDRFTPVYEHGVGRNNNQEIRYVKTGALKGAVIEAEPTENAPFGYWITVRKLAAGGYVQVLRYRSATHYGDGNPLAVIDSEMPNIQQRLGLWRAGAPLPLPAGPCPRPHLDRSVLWCR